jgi:hypothetical protein
MEDEISTEHGDSGYSGTPRYRLLLRARRPSEVFLHEHMQVRTPPETDDDAPAGPGTGPVVERGT